MAYQYLWYEEEDEAKAQSRAKWVQHLGRPKRPEDVTEYLWSRYTPPDKSYWILEIPEEDFHMLAPPEMDDLMPPEDPLVQACFGWTVADVPVG